MASLGFEEAVSRPLQNPNCRDARSSDARKRPSEVLQSPRNTMPETARIWTEANNCIHINQSDVFFPIRACDKQRARHLRTAQRLESGVRSSTQSFSNAAHASIQRGPKFGDTASKITGSIPTPRQPASGRHADQCFDELFDLVVSNCVGASRFPCRRIRRFEVRNSSHWRAPLIVQR